MSYISYLVCRLVCLFVDVLDLPVQERVQELLDVLNDVCNLPQRISLMLNNVDDHEIVAFYLNVLYAIANSEKKALYWGCSFGMKT